MEKPAVKRTYFSQMLFLILISAVFALGIGCAGIPSKNIITIPDGSYVGKYARKGVEYTAIVEITGEHIQSIALKYNGSPLHEMWAADQADEVIKKNSTRVKVIPSPSGKNRLVLKAIDLALQAGLKMAR